MTQWDALKTEYATSQISFKELAKKHGVSYKTLYTHARIEHWADARRLHTQRTLHKSMDQIGDRQAQDLARVDQLADALLQKLGQAIEELDLTVTRHREKGEDDKGTKWQLDYEQREKGGAVDRKGLQQLAASLKDLKQIKALQTELDKLEQEIRIEKLKKEAENGAAPEIQVILEGATEGFGD